MTENNENTYENIKNRVLQFFEMKEKYISNKNINLGQRQLIKNMIECFDLDRVFIGMKSVFTDECIPVIEYKKNGQTNFLSEVKNFSDFTEFADVNISECEKKYIDICDENNYHLREDFDGFYTEILSNLGFVKSDKDSPCEYLLYYIKNKVSFSYVVIERHNDSELLTNIEILALNDIYNSLKSRVEKDMLEKQLHNEAYMKNLIVENEKTPICLVERTENKVIYFNKEYSELMPNVSLGANYYDLFDKDDNFKSLKDEKSLVCKKVSDDTNKYWIRKVMSFRLIDGAKVYMVYIKYIDDYIKELEEVDLLTSAYSLKGFITSYEKLVMSDFEESDYRLCTIDISKFKYINNSYGFSVGNRILKKIAIVLNKFIRKQEFFCRMTEDKFAIVLQCGSNEEVEARLNILFEKLDSMKNQYFTDIKLTYICGVTSVYKNKEINLLLDRANSARNSAKGSHKDIIAFYDEKIEKKIKEELSIEARVEKAVKDGEFVPYLQPKFDLKTMEICGAEALVRWITPTGMIFPDSFIPLFERNGFIDTLDFIIYQKVMEHIRNCLDRGLTVYPISLNVSRNHINNKNFVTQIMELINKYKIPIDLLELEITESVFVEDREKLKYFVDNIKRPKIKVSIDDFGTAYSSLQILKDIDMDILKIDKGFLENIDFTDEHKFTKDEVVLKNIINLARDLNCKVICEGIETDEQIELLKNIGCEYGQGYVFSRPIPIVDYEKSFLISK